VRSFWFLFLGSILCGQVQPERPRLTTQFFPTYISSDGNEIEFATRLQRNSEFRRVHVFRWQPGIGEALLPLSESGAGKLMRSSLLSLSGLRGAGSLANGEVRYYLDEFGHKFFRLDELFLEIQRPIAVEPRGVWAVQEGKLFDLRTRNPIFINPFPNGPEAEHRFFGIMDTVGSDGQVLGLLRDSGPGATLILRSRSEVDRKFRELQTIQSARLSPDGRFIVLIVGDHDRPSSIKVIETSKGHSWTAHSFSYWLNVQSSSGVGDTKISITADSKFAFLESGISSWLMKLERDEILRESPKLFQRIQTAASGSWIAATSASGGLFRFNPSIPFLEEVIAPVPEYEAEDMVVAPGSLVRLRCRNRSSCPGEVSEFATNLPIQIGGIQVVDPEGEALKLRKRDADYLEAVLPWTLPTNNNSSSGNFSVSIRQQGRAFRSSVELIAHQSALFFIPTEPRSSIYMGSMTLVSRGGPSPLPPIDFWQAFASVYHSDWSAVNQENPAVADEVLTAYVFGGGPLLEQPDYGELPKSAAQRETLNKPRCSWSQRYPLQGKVEDLGTAEVLYFGLSSDIVGTYQLVFRAPSPSLGWQSGNVLLACESRGTPIAIRR
jgi:uncharacterized protein (TIGR03437 family)